MTINTTYFLSYSYGWVSLNQFGYKLSFRDMIEKEEHYKQFIHDIKYLNIKFNGENFHKKYKYVNRKDILNEIYKEIKFLLYNLPPNIKYLNFSGFNSYYGEYLYDIPEKYINLIGNYKPILPESLRV